MTNKAKNEILELTTEFSLLIIEFVEKLEAEKKFVIANQLLKAGTSIGANSREAQSSESKTDFAHKFKIAAKEAEETIYWLSLCKAAPSYPSPNEELFIRLETIKKIIGKIIYTSKQSLKN
jgi:four helix bundle protein